MQGLGEAAHHGLVSDALEGGYLAEGEAAAQAHLEYGALLDGEYGEVE